MKRGQVSVEFLTIFGFVFLMTIPLIIIYFDQTQAVNDEIASKQIYTVANELVNKADAIYYLGDPSKTTLKVILPQHIESITANGRTLIITYNAGQDNTKSIAAVAAVNLSVNITPEAGIHYITVQSSGGEVTLTE